MKIRGVRLSLLYMLLLAAMGASAWQLHETTTYAGTCCQYGNQCGSTEVCCSPGSIGAEPCAPGDLKGYCRSSCGVQID
jgi:hypothetical protein